MIGSFLKDILFPIYCVGCEQEGEWCCAKCLLKIEPRPTQECPVCYKEGNGMTCEMCKNSSALDGIVALYTYQEAGALGQLIKQLKYQHARETIKIFKSLAAQALPIYTSCFYVWFHGTRLNNFHF
jgi:predicted amidophosphoribosyltransferase